jgi:uncharacterized OB-fold protein
MSPGLVPFDHSLLVPSVDADTDAFWRACAEHRLVVQRCGVCGEYRFAPAPICHNCSSFDTILVESEGRGELYTWTIVHRPAHPAVEPAVPYNVAVVRLYDCGGAMITTNVVEVANDDLVAGMPLRVRWDDVSEAISLPRFGPA